MVRLATVRLSACTVVVMVCTPLFGVLPDTWSAPSVRVRESESAVSTKRGGGRVGPEGRGRTRTRTGVVPSRSDAPPAASELGSGKVVDVAASTCVSKVKESEGVAVGVTGVGRGCLRCCGVAGGGTVRCRVRDLSVWSSAACRAARTRARVSATVGRCRTSLGRVEGGVAGGGRRGEGDGVRVARGGGDAGAGDVARSGCCCCSCCMW
mmetsp:Transcript_13048/g.41155  ORF Transcript_13048/g.41155 Transcript_13048/m.41155 type:complete len:209 (+) Transcript_13048:183-809(+)